MIFKTFDNDLTRLINKIGVFNKSFNIIGHDLSSGQGLFTSLFSGNNITQKDIQAINAFDAAMKNGLTTAQAWQINMTNCTVAAKEQAKQCLINKGSLSELTTGLQTTTFAAKAGSVALKALSIAANMVAFTLIIKAIEVVANKLDKFANASKHATESAKALASEMNDSISSMSSNASTLSELNNEYQELSKGVNQLGENISLSTNDYSRYKDIINQVSTIMPTLTTYFNAQGERIAFAKGKLEDFNKEYDEYIKKQAKKYVTEGDAEGHTIKDILNSYNSTESLTGFEQFWNGIKHGFGYVTTDDFTPKEIIRELEKIKEDNNKSVQDVYKSIYESIPKNLNNGSRDLTNNDSALKYAIGAMLFGGMSQKEKLSTTEADYNALMENITAYIEDYKTQISAKMDNVRTALLQEVYSKDSYWQIEDKDVRNDIVTFLSSIDSDIWDELDKKTENELSTFVNKIIDSMVNNTDGFADAWNSLFSPELEELSPNECAQQINEFLKIICDALGLDEINGVRILKISLGFENVDAVANNYNSIIKKGAEKFSGVTSQTYGNNAEADLYYEEVLDDLDTFAKENSINSQDEIAFWNKCIEESNTRQEAMNKYLNSPYIEKEPASFTDIFSFKDADDNLNSLGRISESINTIENAYKTLSSARDEYNNNGFISIDTLQSIMELGDDWLNYLVDENGALNLNQESIEELTKSRLEEMRVRTLNNIIDNVKQIKDNTDANKYLKSTNYETAQSFEEVARTSAIATAELLRERVASGELSQGFYDAVIEKMYNDIDKINTLFDNTQTGFSDNAAKSAARSFTELLDKELAVLDKKMEAGYTDFNDYIQARLALIEDYYRQGKLSADEYYSYLEKHYQQELSYRDKVIHAVTRRIDKEIDSLEKQKDKIKENYQIQIDALNEQKTLLQDANKERQRQIDMQKAMYELDRAKNQRTTLIYSEDRGMHYVADDQAIRDAEQNVEDKEFEFKIAEIEKSISNLERARDAETNAIDAMIDKLAKLSFLQSVIVQSIYSNADTLSLHLTVVAHKALKYSA